MHVVNRSILLGLGTTILTFTIAGAVTSATSVGHPEADKTAAGTPNQPTTSKPAALSGLPAGAVLVPLCRQATDYTCGAAALQAVLGFFGEDFNESQLSGPLKSNNKIGTRYEAIEKFLTNKGFEVTVYKDASIRKLEELLDQKQPVIVLIQAWSEKATIDYSKDWEDGHYVVAIGYDANNIYFMDPSTLGHYTYIPVQEFEARWHDKDTSEKLHHFAMTFRKMAKRDANTFLPAQVEYMP